MAAQRLSQYSSGYQPTAPSRDQSRGSQVPAQRQDAWVSKANTSAAQRNTQGGYYQYSSPGPSSSASLARSDLFSMGSWSQSNPARASAQDFNQYVDSIMSTKTSGGGQSKQQPSGSASAPLPWDTTWMPDESQAGGNASSSTRKEAQRRPEAR
ncbi:hypothetical protein BST61_g1106 [Cercospora zeina]